MGTSLRAFSLGQPATPASVDGKTFTPDSAVAAWISSKGIRPKLAGLDLDVWSTAILTSETASWQNDGFFTEVELLQWQAQIQSALSAKSAYASAQTTYENQLATTITAQQALDASPNDSALQTSLNSALSTLASDYQSFVSAQRSYADALAVLTSPSLLGKANPFYNPADFDQLPVAYGSNLPGKPTVIQIDAPNIPAAASAVPPADAGSGAVGSSSDYARADHQHPASAAAVTLKNIWSQFNPQTNVANTALASLAGPDPDSSHTYSRGTRIIPANSAETGTQWDHELLGTLDAAVASEVYHLQLLFGTVAVMNIFPQVDAGVNATCTFRLRISCMVQSVGATGQLNVTGDFFMFSGTGAIVGRYGFFGSSTVDFTQDNAFDFKQAFGTGTGETFVLGQWLIDQRN